MVILYTHPTTFSQAKDPMEAKDRLKGVEKKLVITQCMDHEKVLFAAPSSLEWQQIGGRHTAAPTQMSTLLCGMSSRLISVPTICPAT
jgi:hypothetical protein